MGPKWSLVATKAFALALGSQSATSLKQDLVTFVIRKSLALKWVWFVAVLDLFVAHHVSGDLAVKAMPMVPAAVVVPAAVAAVAMSSAILMPLHTAAPRQLQARSQALR